MSSYISKNVDNIQISGIRRFYNLLSDVPDALSLTLGQPDFKIPEGVRKGILKSIEDGKTGYTSNDGIIELRQEVSKYLSEIHIKYDANEICITVGGSEALFSTFGALIEKDDVVLIPSIAYPAYENCVKVFGGKVITYNLTKDFSLDMEDLKEKIRIYKPKVVVLSFPSNPTGAILTKKNRDEFHELVMQNNFLVITDEIYSSLYYEKEYYSIAQFEDIKEKIIFISGFSKMFSMTGFRIGYVCATDNILKSIIKVHQYNVSCAPSISQWGALSGLKESKQDIELMNREFVIRRNFLCDELRKIGFDVVVPKAAFYVFPSISKFNVKSEEFCKRMLYEGKVAIVPGNAFGISGDNYVRISYSYNMEALREGIKRIKKWIEVTYK